MVICEELLKNTLEYRLLVVLLVYCYKIVWWGMGMERYIDLIKRPVYKNGEVEGLIGILCGSKEATGKEESCLLKEGNKKTWKWSFKELSDFQVIIICVF